MIKDYFLHYNEARVQRLRAFQRRPAGGAAGRDIDDWRITFADTGLDANIGQRLRAVRHRRRARTCSWPTTATP